MAQSLGEYGFIQSYSDNFLFTCQKGAIQHNILVYVDDLIIYGNYSAALSALKKYLCSCFHMKYLGVLNYFLGIEVSRNSESIYLCQRKYILDIIAEVGNLGSKLISFPMEQNHQLARSISPLLDNVEQYRRLVGRLIYLAFTTFDLAYSIHILSQFLNAPRRNHWNVAICVVGT